MVPSVLSFLPPSLLSRSTWSRCFDTKAERDLFRVGWADSLLFAVALSLASGGCASNESDKPDPLGMGGAMSSDMPSSEVTEPKGDGDPWELVEIPGAVCADGSDYKVFVKRNEGSRDLALTLEPGGACWNYATCSTKTGEARAFHLDGIREDHMSALPPPLGKAEGRVPWGLLFPHLGLSDKDAPTASYNHVYFPYCTGDAFLGNLTVEYVSEDGKDSVEIHHRGANNMELARGWLRREFESTRHLLVWGASAGALGATMHYPLFREALGPERASLVNDSGPVFPPGGPQESARGAFAERYRTGELLEQLEPSLGAKARRLLGEDSGHIVRLLAEQYPQDRFLVTYFLTDLNYSIFSYDVFEEWDNVDDLLELWQRDTALLLEEIEQTDNWGYFLPGFRADNCSHTVTLLPALEFERIGYVSSVLRGSADGYLRTGLGSLDFGDALTSLLDPESDLIREQEPDPRASFDANAEEHCLRWVD